MQLTTDQREHFETQGYVIVRELFDAAEMDALIRCAKADPVFATAGGPMDADGRVSRIKLDNYVTDDIYSDFVRCRRIVDNVELLLGCEVYHFHHKMMLKEPRVGGAWEWHQDYGYWYVHNKCLWPDMVSVAIAVDNATRDNGCMQLLAKSHRCGRIDHGTTGEQTGADLERVEALMERLSLLYAELNAGDALFFHSNTLHRSDQNRSENPRWTLIGCYNAAYNSPIDPQPDGHPVYHKLDKLDDEALKARVAAHIDRSGKPQGSAV